MLEYNSVKISKILPFSRVQKEGYCKLLGNIKEIRKLTTLSFKSLFADAIKRSLRKKVEQVCR